MKGGIAAKRSDRRGDMPKETIALKGQKFSDVFSEAVPGAMMEVLGDSAARAMSFYLRPLDFDDVEDFQKKLRAILGTGALALEKVIVRHLAHQLEVPASELRPADLAGSASIARGILEKRGKGPSR
jgi:hypothetical protein